MLEVQKYLKKYGIDKTVKDFSLIYKEKDNLFLLKYNQLEADWSNIINHECRGIILEKITYNVVCLSYFKFFNLGEGYCALIDWESVEYFEKLDGSLMTVWYYKGEWRLSTSGTIDATSTANGGAYTFAELFWNTVTEMYGSKETFLSKLDTNNNYMFELMTPWNIVVTQHAVSKVVLHGVRDMTSWKELSIKDFDLVKAKTFSFKDVDEMRATYAGMTFQDEGFIGMDKNFNRFKDKNPTYVAAHHISTGLSPYHILNVVKNNELSEFLTYFPARKDEIDTLQDEYNVLIEMLTIVYETNLKALVGNVTDKEYAFKVAEVCKTYELKEFSGMFFNLKKNKDMTIKEYVSTFSDKDLYHILKKTKS